MLAWRNSSLYLDLRELTIRVVKGKAVGRTVRIDGYATLKLAAPLGRGGDEKDILEAGVRLAEFLVAQRLAAPRVVLALGREGIITRTVRVPAMAPHLLSDFIGREIGEFLPVDLNEYRYDYRVTHALTSEDDGREYFELLLAAVPRYLIDQALQVIEAAGLKLLVIDVLPNALQHLFTRAPYNDLAVLDLNHDGSRMVVFERGLLTMYADIPFRLPEVDGDFGPLLEEIRGYLNFFASRHHGRQVETLHLVGEAARPETKVPGILREALGLPIQMGLEAVVFLGYGGKLGDRFSEQAAVYGANLGLMLREGVRS